MFYDTRKLSSIYIHMYYVHIYKMIMNCMYNIQLQTIVVRLTKDPAHVCKAVWNCLLVLFKSRVSMSGWNLGEWNLALDSPRSVQIGTDFLTRHCMGNWTQQVPWLMVVQRVQTSKTKMWWSMAFVQHWLFLACLDSAFWDALTVLCADA